MSLKRDKSRRVIEKSSLNSNVNRSESAFLMSSGTQFQRWGAATKEKHFDKNKSLDSKEILLRWSENARAG